MCACSLGYPACNAHAPYFHLWSFRLYNIFSTLYHKLYDFRKRVFGHKIRILICYTTVVWNVSHSKKKGATNDQKMYNSLHVSYSFFLSDFNKTRIFLADYKKKILKSHISWKSVQWELSCSMRTDRHMTKLTSASRNFSNASEKKKTYILPRTLIRFCPKVSAVRNYRHIDIADVIRLLIKDMSSNWLTESFWAIKFVASVYLFQYWIFYWLYVLLTKLATLVRISFINCLLYCTCFVISRNTRQQRLLFSNYLSQNHFQPLCMKTFGNTK